MSDIRLQEWQAYAAQPESLSVGQLNETVRYLREEIHRIKIEAQANLERWSLALQSLTPGGSEYVDDPNRCIAFVRETRESQHQTILRQQADLNHLREQAGRVRFLTSQLSSAKARLQKLHEQAAVRYALSIEDLVENYDSTVRALSSAKEEVERLNGTTRVIDGKFAVRGGVIVKMSSGEVVPEDEPLVLMRGRDHLMVATLMHYRNLCRLDGCNDYQLGLVDALIEKFTRYASDPSRMKQPGVTRGAAWNPHATAPPPEGDVRP